MARQPTSGWQWIEDYDRPEPVQCVTVGWLVKETSDTLLDCSKRGRHRLEVNGNSTAEQKSPNAKLFGKRCSILPTSMG
jgi:hypothetical protein